MPVYVCVCVCTYVHIQVSARATAVLLSNRVTTSVSALSPR